MLFVGAALVAAGVFVKRREIFDVALDGVGVVYERALKLEASETRQELEKLRERTKDDALELVRLGGEALTPHEWLERFLGWHEEFLLGQRGDERLLEVPVHLVVVPEAGKGVASRIVYFEEGIYVLMSPEVLENPLAMAAELSTAAFSALAAIVQHSLHDMPLVSAERCLSGPLFEAQADWAAETALLRLGNRQCEAMVQNRYRPPYKNKNVPPLTARVASGEVDRMLPRLYEPLMKDQLFSTIEHPYTTRRFPASKIPDLFHDPELLKPFKEAPLQPNPLEITRVLSSNANRTWAARLARGVIRK